VGISRHKFDHARHSPKARSAAIVGGGWAGFAAALTLARSGWRVTLYEAAREAGGRARALELAQIGGAAVRVDNGQHILIGAYTESLRLMRSVGVDCAQALHRQALALPYADGSGLRFAARWPAPLDALLGILGARGWPWRERAALLARTLRWCLARFDCADDATVATLCHGLPPKVMLECMEPLCISALNTPPHEASARVFLRVLRDALLHGRGGSHFLLPRCDLGQIFPVPAMQWLRAHGHTVHLGQRVLGLHMLANKAWHVQAQHASDALFDAVLLACPAPEAARLALAAAQSLHENTHENTHENAAPLQAAWQRWAAQAQALQYRPIATVYAQTRQRGACLPPGQPWLALRTTPEQPAQFVFDRGQLGGPAGLMAFVVSHSTAARAALQTQVLAQARAQLGWHDVQALGTVVDKRATFACLPQLQRPASALGGSLWACGDYTSGPYPATLEGAVRSAVQAAQALAQVFTLSQ